MNNSEKKPRRRTNRREITLTYISYKYTEDGVPFTTPDVDEVREHADDPEKSLANPIVVTERHKVNADGYIDDRTPNEKAKCTRQAIWESHRNKCTNKYLDWKYYHGNNVK